MATSNFPFVLPRIALLDHDYLFRDMDIEGSGDFMNSRIVSSSTQLSTQPQICSSPINTTLACWNPNPNSTAFSYSNDDHCQGSFSICIPVAQTEIFPVSSDISLCLLSENGESNSLLAPGWMNGQTKCAMMVKNLIFHFDTHIKNPICHFTVMERYIVEVLKIASKLTAKNQDSPYRILIEPCILSLRAINQIYKSQTNFSLPASKYYFMFLLDRIKFIRKEIAKIQACQNNGKKYVSL